MSQTVHSRLRFGGFVLDLAGRRLWRGADEILLTPKALDVLAFLAERPGEVVERDALLEALWPGTYVDDHALSVQIGEVRKVLDDRPGTPRFIETRHRRGYRFIAPVTRELVEAAREPAPVTAPASPARAAALDGVPETRYARSGDVDIAYQVVGEPKGIDIVFVMGWVSHLEYFWKEPSFASFLRRLAGFSRLILFDKRGTGLSDRVPIAQLPTLEQRMDDLRAVMDAVGSERAAILGVSEGGPMSALFSATYPEKTLALVMIGTYARRLRDAAYPWGPTLEERSQFFEEIQRNWGGPVGIEQRAPSRADDAAFRDWWATYLRMGASPGAAIALTKMNADIDVRHVLPSVRVPSLVIHRTGDRCLTVEEGRYVASLIPRARFLELPGVDHLPFVGDQVEMLDEIEDFLTSIRFTLEPERVLATVLMAGTLDAEDFARIGAHAIREIDWFRGQLVEGSDGVAATFDGPARAARCAAAIIRHAQRAGIAARAALHSGECDTFGGRVTGGPAVSAAARILEAAPAGEVLVSSTVRDLVAGSGIRFTERGLVDAWPVYRVEG